MDYLERHKTDIGPVLREMCYFHNLGIPLRSPDEQLWAYCKSKIDFHKHSELKRAQRHLTRKQWQHYAKEGYEYMENLSKALLVQILYLRPARRTKKRKLSEEDEKLGEELGEKLGEELDEELQARQLERLSGLFSRSAWRRDRALLGK
jgi:hypothetical protein